VLLLTRTAAGHLVKKAEEVTVDCSEDEDDNEDDEHVDDEDKVHSDECDEL
jgi:hypothetical protein